MAALSPEKAHRRAIVASLTRAVRAGERPQSDLDDARRGLAEQQITEYVQKVLALAPPLSDEQRTRLAELLRPVRQGQTARVNAALVRARETVVAERIAKLDGGGDHAA
jgi:hypothetical protein